MTEPRFPYQDFLAPWPHAAPVCKQPARRPDLEAPAAEQPADRELPPGSPAADDLWWEYLRQQGRRACPGCGESPFLG